MPNKYSKKHKEKLRKGVRERYQKFPEVKRPEKDIKIFLKKKKKKTTSPSSST